jgi:hypothetical protein
MHMTPAEGQTEDEITARYTRNLRGNLRAMKKALGLPLTAGPVCGRLPPVFAP